MYLLHQAFTVPLNRFPPDESVLVGFDSIFVPSMYSTFRLMKPLEERKYGLRKHLVDFLLHPVAETVDGNEIGFSYPASQI